MPSRRCKGWTSLLLSVLEATTLLLAVLEATPHLLVVLEATLLPLAIQEASGLLGLPLANLEATHSPIQRKVEALGGYHKLQGSHMTVAAKN